MLVLCNITVGVSNLLTLNVVFLILTKNEEKSIENLISDLTQEALRQSVDSFKIIVIDDSTDQTRAHAERAKAIVFKGPGLGLGGAYRFGLQKCLELNPKIIVSLDGDGQVDIQELPLFLNGLQSGYDLVVGSRFLNRILINYKYPKINFVGSRILSAYLTFMTNQKITDSHGGFRAMRADVARNTIIFGNFTYVQEALIEAAEQSFKILEIASVWKARKYGESRVLRSISKYIVKVGPVLLRRFVRKIIFGKSR